MSDKKLRHWGILILFFFKDCWDESPSPVSGNVPWQAAGESRPCRWQYKLVRPFFPGTIVKNDQLLYLSLLSWLFFHSLNSKTPSTQACEELGCRIDYLATHDYEGNAKHVMNRLEMLYNRWVFCGSNHISFFLHRPELFTCTILHMTRTRKLKDTLCEILSK